MSQIGCGLHVKDIPPIVKSMLDYDQSNSKFPDNLPSVWWVRRFFPRHPELSMRTPEVLGHSRLKVTKEDLLDWFKGDNDL